jgi:hypothetical protein
MTTYDLSSLVAHLYDVRQRKNDLEKTEKSILAELKPLVDPQFDETLGESQVLGGFVLSRVAGVNRTIQADLLLERGVSPEIIAYSTKTSTYFQYRIKEQK